MTEGTSNIIDRKKLRSMRVASKTKGVSQNGVEDPSSVAITTASSTGIEASLLENQATMQSVEEPSKDHSAKKIKKKSKSISDDAPDKSSKKKKKSLSVSSKSTSKKKKKSKSTSSHNSKKSSKKKYQEIDDDGNSDEEGKGLGMSQKSISFDSTVHDIQMATPVDASVSRRGNSKSGRSARFNLGSFATSFGSSTIDDDDEIPFWKKSARRNSPNSPTPSLEEADTILTMDEDFLKLNKSTSKDVKNRKTISPPPLSDDSDEASSEEESSDDEPEWVKKKKTYGQALGKKVAYVPNQKETESSEESSDDEPEWMKKKKMYGQALGKKVAYVPTQKKPEIKESAKEEKQTKDDEKKLAEELLSPYANARRALKKTNNAIISIPSSPVVKEKVKKLETEQKDERLNSSKGSLPSWAEDFDAIKAAVKKENGSSGNEKKTEKESNTEELGLKSGVPAWAHVRREKMQKSGVTRTDTSAAKTNDEKTKKEFGEKTDTATTGLPAWAQARRTSVNKSVEGDKSNMRIPKKATARDSSDKGGKTTTGKEVRLKESEQEAVRAGLPAWANARGSLKKTGSFRIPSSAPPISAPAPAPIEEKSSPTKSAEPETKTSDGRPAWANARKTLKPSGSFRIPKSSPQTPAPAPAPVPVEDTPPPTKPAEPQTKTSDGRPAWANARKSLKPSGSHRSIYSAPPEKIPKEVEAKKDANESLKKASSYQSLTSRRGSEGVPLWAKKQSASEKKASEVASLKSNDVDIKSAPQEEVEETEEAKSVKERLSLWGKPPRAQSARNLAPVAPSSTEIDNSSSKRTKMGKSQSDRQVTASVSTVSHGSHESQGASNNHSNRIAAYLQNTNKNEISKPPIVPSVKNHDHVSVSSEKSSENVEKKNIPSATARVSNKPPPSRTPSGNLSVKERMKAWGESQSSLNRDKDASSIGTGGGASHTEGENDEEKSIPSVKDRKKNWNQANDSKVSPGIPTKVAVAGSVLLSPISPAITVEKTNTERNHVASTETGSNGRNKAKTWEVKSPVPAYAAGRMALKKVKKDVPSSEEIDREGVPPLTRMYSSENLKKVTPPLEKKKDHYSLPPSSQSPVANLKKVSPPVEQKWKSPKTDGEEAGKLYSSQQELLRKVNPPIDTDSKEQEAENESPADIEDLPSYNKTLIVLISSASGKQNQKSAQDRALTILKGMGIGPDQMETIDGVDTTKKDRRNELFDISGERGTYPQFFLVDSNDKVKFMANWEGFESMHEMETLSKSMNLAPLSKVGGIQNIDSSKESSPEDSHEKSLVNTTSEQADDTVIKPTDAPDSEKSQEKEKLEDSHGQEPNKTIDEESVNTVQTMPTIGIDESEAANDDVVSSNDTDAVKEKPTTDDKPKEPTPLTPVDSNDTGEAGLATDDAEADAAEVEAESSNEEANLSLTEDNADGQDTIEADAPAIEDDSGMKEAISSSTEDNVEGEATAEANTSVAAADSGNEEVVSSPAEDDAEVQDTVEADGSASESGSSKEETFSSSNAEIEVIKDAAAADSGGDEAILSSTKDNSDGQDTVEADAPATEADSGIKEAISSSTEDNVEGEATAEAENDSEESMATDKVEVSTSEEAENDLKEQGASDIVDVAATTEAENDSEEPLTSVKEEVEGDEDDNQVSPVTKNENDPDRIASEDKESTEDAGEPLQEDKSISKELVDVDTTESAGEDKSAEDNDVDVAEGSEQNGELVPHCDPEAEPEKEADAASPTSNGRHCFTEDKSSSDDSSPGEDSLQKDVALDGDAPEAEVSEQEEEPEQATIDTPHDPAGDSEGNHLDDSEEQSQKPEEEKCENDEEVDEQLATNSSIAVALNDMVGPKDQDSTEEQEEQSIPEDRSGENNDANNDSQSEKVSRVASEAEESDSSTNDENKGQEIEVEDVVEDNGGAKTTEECSTAEAEEICEVDKPSSDVEGISLSTETAQLLKDEDDAESKTALSEPVSTDEQVAPEDDVESEKKDDEDVDDVDVEVKFGDEAENSASVEKSNAELLKILQETGYLSTDAAKEGNALSSFLKADDNKEDGDAKSDKLKSSSSHSGGSSLGGSLKKQKSVRSLSDHLSSHGPSKSPFEIKSDSSSDDDESSGGWSDDDSATIKSEITDITYGTLGSAVVVDARAQTTSEEAAKKLRKMLAAKRGQTLEEIVPGLPPGQQPSGKAPVEAKSQANSGEDIVFTPPSPLVESDESDSEDEGDNTKKASKSSKKKKKKKSKKSKDVSSSVERDIDVSDMFGGGGSPKKEKKKDKKKKKEKKKVATVEEDIVFDLSETPVHEEEVVVERSKKKKKKKKI